jgi:hypothetical protein
MIAYVAMAVLLCGSCATYPKGEEPWPEEKLRYRWETNEIPYSEAAWYDKGGRNVRDGIVGIINNLFQGVSSGFILASQSGYVVQKFAVVVGDVIGLIDDNPWTEHIFKGVLSRQFLKFGSAGAGMPNAIAGIHETRFEVERNEAMEYLDESTFHTRVYGTPSGITALLAIFAADGIIRPGGNLITIFWLRDSGEALDRAGLNLIEAGLRVNFI